MNNFILWKTQIVQAIEGLNTIGYQFAGGWYDNANFRAAIQRLYVDANFSEFLSYQAWRQVGVGEALGNKLESLRHQLDLYDEPDSDAAVLADPIWQAIQVHGREVAFLLRQELSASVATGPRVP